MNGEYLADTSVVVDLLRFGESPIVPKGAEILICATVLLLDTPLAQLFA